MSLAQHSKSKYPFWQTVRGRLLLFAILVEVVMLVILVWNSLRLVDWHMTNQEQRHANEISPVLIAALIAPMAQRDYATVQAVLNDSRTGNEIEYLVVKNSGGVIVASTGWDTGKPLPKNSRTSNKQQNGESHFFHVSKPIISYEQQLGTLHFGIDSTPIVMARQQMLLQGISIAAIELILSVLILTAIGVWLTRQLSALTKASEAVANGDYPIPSRLPEADNDMGRLCAAFNTMSRAVAERVQELTKARDVQSQLVNHIQEEQSRISALLSAMDLGVLLLDVNERIIYENPAFRKIFSVAENQVLVGMTVRDVFLSVLPQMSEDIFSPQEDQPESYMFESTQCELLLLNKKIISERTLVVRNEGGGIAGQLFLFDDVTAIRNAEKQLISAKEAAELARKVQASFLATMSHEIRTPMNGIIGMTNLILMTDLNSEQREYLSWIKSSSDSLLTVLNDILDYSKIDSGMLNIEHISYSIIALINEVIGLYSVVAQEKNIKLLWRSDEALPEAIFGDPVRMRQILSNLVSNALKFTEAGQIVLEVSTPVQESGRIEFLRLTVSDTGCGIPKDKQGEIFAPFVQADSSTTRRFGGSGLGLAIVKRLVDLLGGHISLESEVGVGSKFYVVVPTEENHQLSAPIKPSFILSETQKGSNTSINVLLVEDTPVNQRLGELVLAKLGHRVRIAADGIEAIAAFQNEPFDAILMDLQMPNMDGLDATKRIREIEAQRENKSHVPIIGVTASAMESDRKLCLDAGMDDYVAKPFQMDRLAFLLTKYTSNRES